MAGFLSLCGGRSFVPRLVVLCAMTSVGVFGGVSEARAMCAASIAMDAADAGQSNAQDVTAMSNKVKQKFKELTDTLIKLANQGTNDIQNVTNGLGVMTDRDNTRHYTDAVGQTRAEIATQFVPSRTTCKIATEQNRLAATSAAVSASRTETQDTFRKLSTNAPGSDSEKGTLAAMNKGFTHRCGLYANKDTMQAPPALCAEAADAEFKDLDIQPWKALIDPITFQDAKHRTAAIDAVKMLTDISPPDPLKGPALSRTDGENLHMLRMRDVTRMNLARGILEDMVAMRSQADLSGGGGGGAENSDDGKKVSRLGRYIELITGQTVDGNTLSGALPVIMASAEPENAAVQTASARLATQQAIIFELMRLTEQLVSVEAVELAIKVERTRAGNAGVASRSLSN